MNSVNGSVDPTVGQRREGRVFDADQFFRRERIPESASLLPHPVGVDLTTADYSALDARWIDRHVADCAHLRRVDSMTGCDIVGRRDGNYAGIAIPYFVPGSERVREYRLRRDHPDLEYESADNVKDETKAPGSAKAVQHALLGA